MALALLPLVSMAAQCDRMLADRPALLERTVDARGGERVKQSVRLTANQSVLVIAREQDVDITLEILDSAGTRVAAADNPVRRTGVQRAFFNARTSGDYSVEIVGKERADVRGKVQLRVVALPSRDDACAKVHQTLANADADYAMGQSVTSGKNTDPAANADKSYQSAAKGYRSLSDMPAAQAASPLLAEARHSLAAVTYQYLNDYAQADALAGAAAQSLAASGDSYGQARAQALQAESLIELAVSPAVSSGADASKRAHDMLVRARSLLEAAAAFHAARGELYDKARAFNDLGLTYFQEVRYEQAIPEFKRALAVFESIGNSLWRANVLQNMATSELQLGRATDAVSRYTALLQMISAKESASTYNVVLNNAALGNLNSGNLDTALEQYGDALDMARDRQDRAEEVRGLHGLGAVYYALGDRDLALNFFRQALALSPPGSDGVVRMGLLRVIGNIAAEQGDTDEALKMHRAALQLAPTPSRVANIRVQLAKDLEMLGRKQDALEEVDTVLSQQMVGGDLRRAEALVVRSRLRMTDASSDAKAIEADLRSALKTFGEFESPARELEAWIEVARLHHLRGAQDKALAAVDRALDLTEELRLQSANPELRASLMQPLRPAFDLKIAMLTDRYFDQRANQHDETFALEALRTAEQARARALADFQAFDASGAAVSPEQSQRRLALYKELSSRRNQLEFRLDRSGSNDPRVAALRSEIAGLRQQLDTVNAEIASSGMRTRAQEKRTAPALLDRQSVPANTAVVEYWLGAEDALAWVLTRDALTLVRLGRSSQVDDAARAFHTSLRNFGSVPLADRLQAADRLHAIIMQPLLPLLSGKRTIVFAPDGALHYVPFAALRGTETDGRTAFLIESHDLAVTASIGTLLSRGTSARATAVTKQMLLVDDPVYGTDDARFVSSNGAAESTKRPPLLPFALLRSGMQEGSALPRLPGTAREAAAIAALLPKDQVDQLEGFAATKDRFLSTDLGRYRFIHVASHAVADAEIPQLSALILSTHDQKGTALDSRVLAADLLNRQLAADAVVLSACDTALGKNIAGEGLMGLRYVVLARGAKAVMSSLWEVPDVVAAQTMTRFYTGMLRQNLGTIPASSQALREMIAGQYKDPALWAAFAVTVSGLSH
jgi:CHAT domain-containing protein